MLFVYWRNKPILMNELIDFATQYGTVQKRLLNEFEVPYAVMDATGKLLWMNRQFEALSEKIKDITNPSRRFSTDHKRTDGERG